MAASTNTTSAHGRIPASAVASTKIYAEEFILIALQRRVASATVVRLKPAARRPIAA